MAEQIKSIDWDGLFSKFDLDNSGQQPPTQAPTKTNPSYSTPKTLPAGSDTVLTGAQGDAEGTGAYQAGDTVRTIEKDKRTYDPDKRLNAQDALQQKYNLIGGTAGTNANQKDADETLRLSRLTDALNNRVWTPTAIGGVATKTYGQSAFQDTTYNPGKTVETEETRQQARTRQYETDNRNIMNNVRQLSEQYEELKAQGLDEDTRNLYYQTVLGYINTGIRQKETRFNLATQIQSLNTRAENIMAYLDSGKTELANYLTQLYGAGVVGDPVTDIFNKLTRDVAMKYQNGEMTMDQVETEITQIYSRMMQLALGLASTTTGTAMGGLKTAAKNIKTASKTDVTQQ